MKSKKIITFFMVLLFSLSIFLPSKYIVKADTSPQISYSFSSSNIQVGQSFDITVNSSNISDLYGASIDFNYDPTSIQITGIEQGNIFKNSGQTVNANTYVNDTTNGKISFGEILQGNVSGLSFTSSNSLFVIHAKALKSGTTPLKTISDNSNNSMSATGNNVCVKLSDSNGGAINYTSNIVNININSQTPPSTITTHTLRVTVADSNYTDLDKFQICDANGNWTDYDDSSSMITYSDSSWITDTAGSYFGGTARFSKSPNSYFEITFTGSGIRLYGTQYANKGKATVTLDGQPQTAIDSYSTTLKIQNKNYELSIGNNNSIVTTHTLRVTVADSNYTDLDKFQICDANGNWTDYDDSSSMVTYSDSSWITDTAAPYFGGTARFSKSPNSYFEITFTGSGIRLYGTQYANKGKATVTLDGHPQVAIDSYSTTLKIQNKNYELLIGNNNSIVTTHTLRVTVADSNYTDLDKFQICDANGNWTDYDDSSSMITYSDSSWITDTAGSYFGGTARFSKSPNSYFEITFTGSGIRLYGTQYANKGKATVTLDGHPQTAIDSYSTTLRIQNKNYELLIGNNNSIVTTHTLRVTVADSNYTDLDKFQICDANGNWTDYDDSSSMVTYSDSSWITDTAAPYFGGTARFSKSPNSYFEITFTGSGIRLYGTQFSNKGTASITLDGQPQTSMNSYSTALKTQNKNYELLNLN